MPPQTSLPNPGPAYPRLPAPAQRTVWRRGDSAWPDQWGRTARRPAQIKTHTRAGRAAKGARSGGRSRVERAAQGLGPQAGLDARRPGLRGAPGRAGRAAGGGGAAEFPGAAGLRAHWPAPHRDVTLGGTGKPPRVTWPGGGAGREREAGRTGGVGPVPLPLALAETTEVAWGHSRRTHGTSRETEACPPGLPAGAEPVVSRAVREALGSGGPGLQLVIMIFRKTSLSMPQFLQL